MKGLFVKMWVKLREFDKGGDVYFLGLVIRGVLRGKGRIF